MLNNRFVTLLLILSAASCTNVREKCTSASGYSVSEDTVSVCINGSIPVEGKWDAKWLHRYADDVDGLAAKAAADPRQEIDVVFFGSSSIRLWKGLEEMMAPLSVVNRGYGGATVRDILVNYEKAYVAVSPEGIRGIL